MFEVKGLTQLQQVRGNRGPHSGEHGTRGHCCVPDDCGRQLTSEHVQHPGTSQKAKFTEQHQGQGESWITCREEEGCKLTMGKRNHF